MYKYGRENEKSTYHFLENSGNFIVMKIELLLTLLSNFEREAVLKVLCYLQFLKNIKYIRIVLNLF